MQEVLVAIFVRKFRAGHIQEDLSKMPCAYRKITYFIIVSWQQGQMKICCCQLPRDFVKTGQWEEEIFYMEKTIEIQAHGRIAGASRGKNFLYALPYRKGSSWSCDMPSRIERVQVGVETSLYLEMAIFSKDLISVTSKDKMAIFSEDIMFIALKDKISVSSKDKMYITSKDINNF